MDTDYEPYIAPQLLTLATPNGLPGVPVDKDGNYTDKNGQQWVCDEIDLGRGKYVQRVAKTVINTFTDGADYGTEIRLVKDVDNMKNMNDCIMSTVARSVNSGSAKNTCRIYQGMQIFFFVSKDKFADLNAANEFFADNPVEFRVGLAAPIERDLTPEELAAYEALHTNYPTTVITNDAGVHMEVSYVADTRNYIRNLEERLNAKLVNIQSALISQKISGGGIKVADSAKLPIQNLRVFGKSKQTQTTGAQLLHDDLYKTITTKGVTIELNNCVVSFKGTFINDGTTTRPVLDVLLNKEELAGKTLSLVSDHPESYLSFRITRINGEKEYALKEVTIDETVKEVFARFFYREKNPSSGTVINETQKVMLCESKHKELPWEPYSGGFSSPSTDWEQPISNAGENGSIEVGITGESEEPQNLVLATPNGLPGIPVISGGNYTDSSGQQWVCDEIDLGRGKYVKRVNKVRLKASSSVSDAVQESFSSYLCRLNELPDVPISNYRNIMCNVLKNTGSKNINSIRLGSNDRYIYCYLSEQYKGMSIDSINAVFESKNAYAIYSLESPIEYDLTPEEITAFKTLHTNHLTTTVTNNADAEMELTYTVDTKSYVDSKIAAISAAVLEV